MDTFRFIVTGEYKYVKLENGEMIIKDGHYLKGSVFEDQDDLQLHEISGLYNVHDNVVQLAYLDQFNEFEPMNIDVNTFADSPIVSADGIPILTSGVRFALSIFDEDSNTSEMDLKVIFGSHNYTQGIPFEIVKEDGEIYVKSLFDNNYLGIKENEGIHTFYFSQTKPQKNIKFVPVKFKSMFVISDGECYYKIHFFKGSYGEARKVENIEKATVFQWISY